MKAKAKATKVMQLQLEARCTSCRRKFVVSDQERREARDIGCFISPCCFAVATVHSATLKRVKVPA